MLRIISIRDNFGKKKLQAYVRLSFLMAIIMKALLIKAFSMQEESLCYLSRNKYGMVFGVMANLFHRIFESIPKNVLTKSNKY